MDKRTASAMNSQNVDADGRCVARDGGCTRTHYVAWCYGATGQAGLRECCNSDVTSKPVKSQNTDCG